MESAVSQRELARGSISKSRRYASLVPYAFVAPAVILYATFKLLPIVAGLYLAQLRWDGLNPAEYVGFANFSRIFQDDLVLLALKNNVMYAFGTVIGKITLSLALALLLHQGLRGRGFYRTALFMPVVMSFVVVGILWRWMYNSQFGLVNAAFRALGLERLIQNWLADPKVALGSLIAVDIWKWYGFHMVIFLAGLQSIPYEYYEAARIDGATRVRQFLSITLPLLAPVMLVNVTTSLMGGFNVFDIPFVMTEGGPANSTLVLALHIYLRGFKFYRFGYAAAMSYALLVLVVVITAVQLKLMSRNLGSQ